MKQRDPATPLWWGTIVLRLVTLAFAAGALAVNLDNYQRPTLAVVVFVAMCGWTAGTVAVYLREPRPAWFVAADVLVTCVLMLTSPFVLSDAQYAVAAPLTTTVWAAGPPLAAGARFGASGGVAGGLVLAVSTGIAQLEIDLDVARDGVLLIASGLLIGAAATTARRSQARLAEALRTEAATAERERLARSIHDSVLQVLARVRRRGAELGGDAAELAEMAGEQEIALRALVSSKPATEHTTGCADLRAALQLLATPKVQISAPAGEVRLPAGVASELAAATAEALSNVDKHAGPGAMAWVLLEDLNDEVIVTVRDNGPGIPEGRLEQATADGHLGVSASIRGRIADIGGTIELDSAPGAGTEWEFRVPRTQVAERAEGGR